MVGMARSAVDLGRFIAAEVHQPELRGRAISKVVLGSTVGAIVGPLLVGPTGKLATMAGLPELAGPYSVGFVVLVLASILILSGLRPEPRDIGRELSRGHTESAPAQETRSLSDIVRQPSVIVAMVTMVFAQMVMVVPMSITSVHMKTHQYPLSMVSLVISAHTLGMFAFSLITGKMTDRWGRLPVIILGASIMIISCLIGGSSVNLLALVIALFLLGLGWIFPMWRGQRCLPTSFQPQRGPRHRGSTTCS
jgi:predicted MFS family arabinose efflux permease